MTDDPSRRRLAELLRAFLRGQVKEDYFLDDPHRRFYRKLSFEMFRHIGFIQKILPRYVKKKPAMDAEVALIIGTAQILFMDDIPDYAAVSSAVALAPKHSRSFVNGVLRNIVRQREQLTTSHTVHDDFPDWLTARWKTRLGSNELTALLNAMNTTPPLSAFDQATGRIMTDTDFDGLPDTAYAMDAASIMIPRLAGTGERRRILDACAAPGGKTLVLSTDHPDANITAVEVQKNRCEAMARFLDEKDVTNVTVMQDDILNVSPERSFDLVLLDAPCTALGTMRRHPEVRWLRTMEDVNRASDRQQTMLAHAATLVSPGGRLIYSVCSLEPEEGKDVVEQFMKNTDGFRLITPDAPEEFLEDGLFVAWPHNTGTDGFFAAVIERMP